LSEAGRILFGASLARRTSANDADRLRKYLARFGLDWGAVRKD
jgi:transcriptional regulatory protein RtcR